MRHVDLAAITQPTQAGIAVVQAAAGGHGAQHGRHDEAPVRRRVIVAGRRVDPGRGGRQVAARAEQVDGRGRRPQREPAPALALALHALVVERRAIGQLLHAARIGRAAEHQVAARIDAHAAVARHQDRPAAGDRRARRVGFIRPRFLRIGAVEAQFDAAHGARLQAQRAAQVGQRAVQARHLAFETRVRVRPVAVTVEAAHLGHRVQPAADADIEIAAARQQQLAVRRHPARAAHSHVQALAARRVCAARIGARGQHAGVAARLQQHIAAAQGADARKARHDRQAGKQVAAFGPRDIGAEVDPPCRRHARARAAAALAPQPGADVAGVLLRVQRADGILAALQGGAHGVALDIALGAQQQVAAVLGIPGAVQALAAAIDEARQLVVERAEQLALGAQAAR